MAYQRKYLNDETLIDALKIEDRDAIKFFYSKYYKVAFNFVTKNNGQAQDAEEIFQDAIIIILRNAAAGKLDELSCSLNTYLYSIIRNNWLYQLRLKAKMPKSIYDLEDIKEQIPEKVHDDIMQLILHTLLKQTKEPCKGILIDFYYNNSSLNDIAIKYKYKNANVAKTKKDRCMGKIRVQGKDLIQNYLKSNE